MRRAAAILVLALSAAPALAEPIVFEIVPGESEASFTLTSSVNDIAGTSSALSGSIRIDPEDPSKSAIEASLNAASLKTGNDLRDEHLRSDKFLDAEKFPKIAFKSTSVASDPPRPRPGAPARVRFEGSLSVHGVEKPLRGEAEIAWEEDGRLAVGTATFLVNLPAHGVEVPRFMGLFPYEPDARVTVKAKARETAR